MCGEFVPLPYATFFNSPRVLRTPAVFYARSAGGPDPSRRRIGVAPAVNLPDVAAFTAEREVIQPGAIPYPIEQLALGLCLGIGPAA